MTATLSQTHPHIGALAQLRSTRGKATGEVITWNGIHYEGVVVQEDRGEKTLDGSPVAGDDGGVNVSEQRACLRRNINPPTSLSLGERRKYLVIYLL